MIYDQARGQICIQVVQSSRGSDLMTTTMNFENFLIQEMTIKTEVFSENTKMTENMEMEIWFGKSTKKSCWISQNQAIEHICFKLVISLRMSGSMAKRNGSVTITFPKADKEGRDYYVGNSKTANNKKI